jgi:hypothetical protein
MKGGAHGLVKVLVLTLATCGVAGNAAILTMPDVAIAKSNKQKKGAEKAKHGKSQKAPKSVGRSATPSQTSSNGASEESRSGKKPYKGGNAVAVALGVHPSELGNLNAWNGKSGASQEPGMPGRLAEFEALVRLGAEVEANKSTVDLAAGVFGDAPCDPVTPTDCSYDLALLFPSGQPVEGDEGYEDYLIAAAANDALAFLSEQQAEGSEFGWDAEMAALADISNKPVTDNLLTAIRDWILADQNMQANNN